MKKLLTQVRVHLLRFAYLVSIALICFVSTCFISASVSPANATPILSIAFGSTSANEQLGTNANEQLGTKSEISSPTTSEQVEEQKQSAVKNAEDLLDDGAISAVQQTKEAILDLEANNPAEALQHLEEATGKLDILLAREPDLALIPISSTVEIIDTAPLSKDIAEAFRDGVTVAIEKGDYAYARELLANMISEVRTQIVNVPLATYPEAMKIAAGLIDANKLEEAQEVLEVALSTLVIVERTQPIPVIDAQTSLVGAVAIAPDDKDEAIRLLDAAREDLRLAKALGYLSKDRNYGELDKQIDDIEGKLKRDIDLGSAFEKVEDKLSSFLESLSR